MKMVKTPASSWSIVPEGGLVGKPLLTNIDALLRRYEEACGGLGDDLCKAINVREALGKRNDRLAELEAEAAFAAQDGPNQEARKAAAKKRLVDDPDYQQLRVARDQAAQQIAQLEVHAELQRRTMQGVRAAMFALAGTFEDG